METKPLLEKIERKPINFLPWREAFYREKSKTFCLTFIGSLLVTLSSIISIDMIYSQKKKKLTYEQKTLLQKVQILQKNHENQKHHSLKHSENIRQLKWLHNRLKKQNQQIKLLKYLEKLNFSNFYLKSFQQEEKQILWYGYAQSMRNVFNFSQALEKFSVLECIQLINTKKEIKKDQSSLIQFKLSAQFKE
jgi:Tfp pilus assembly protein PilN